MIDKGLITAAHDISDGGLGVAVAEMALAGNKGAILDLQSDIPLHGLLFAENQGCYVITVAADSCDMVHEMAASAEVPLTLIGMTGHNELKINQVLTISIDDLRKVHENWMPDLMSGPGSK
jgi:phosphoribosylformylglycinamidine synthase